MRELRDYATGEQIKDSWHFSNELDQIPLIIKSTITLAFVKNTGRVKAELKKTYVIRDIHTKYISVLQDGMDYSKFKTSIFVQEVNPFHHKRRRINR